MKIIRLYNSHLLCNAELVGFVRAYEGIGSLPTYETKCFKLVNCVIIDDYLHGDIIGCGERAGIIDFLGNKGHFSVNFLKESVYYSFYEEDYYRIYER